MDPRLGGRYSYTTEKGTVVVNNVSEFECHGEILEYDPPRVLVYTWLANWHDDVARRTVVRWELTPTKTGTHVKVTHSGLAQEAAAQGLQQWLARRSRNAEEVRRTSEVRACPTLVAFSLRQGWGL